MARRKRSQTKEQREATREKKKEAVAAHQKTISDKILAYMEEGSLVWRKPFQGGAFGGFGISAQTGKPYNGANVVTLWLSCMENGYSSPYWITFKNMESLGGSFKTRDDGQRQRGTKIIFVGQTTVDDEKSPTGKKLIKYSKLSSVFNLDQVQGIDFSGKYPEPEEFVSGAEMDGRLETFKQDTGAVFFQHSQPHYLPATDKIGMPGIDRFENTAGYYGVVLHELAHWTGAEHRLARDGVCKDEADRTRPEYAFEELVAEITSCFIGCELGVNIDLKNSAAYIDSWKELLKNDKTAIFKACSEARVARDFLIEQATGSAPDYLDEKKTEAA